jgi:hypothetical protein
LKQYNIYQWYFDLQVTLDNSNFDLSKWNPGPDFFPYTTKQIYSRTFDLSKFSISRSDFGSRDINFIVFHSRSLEVIIHTFTPNYFLVNLPGSYNPC